MRRRGLGAIMELPVPRFYFHLGDAEGLTKDIVGRELPNLQAAHAAALHDARSLMAEEIILGEIDFGSFIQIHDQNHKRLLTLTFHEAVKVKSTRC